MLSATLYPARNVAISVAADSQVTRLEWVENSEARSISIGTSKAVVPFPIMFFNKLFGVFSDNIFGAFF